MLRFTNRILGLFVGLCVLAVSAQAQVNVPPGIGTLDDAVNNNTVSGQVFVLEAGQTYTLSDRMEPTVSLTIQADGGNCPVVPADCPLIQPESPDPLDPDDEVERVFGLEDDGVSLTLQQVAVTNTSPSGDSDERTIRFQAADLSATLDRVLVFDEPTMVFRIDDEAGDGAAAPDLFIHDSVFKDIDDRVLDDRGNDLGEVVFFGNTFYSIGGRVARDDGAVAASFRFEHNTVQFVRERILDTGDVTGDVLIRNNLLVDTGYRGGEAGDDPESQVRVGDVQGDATVSHNSWVFDNALLEDPVAPTLYDGGALDAIADNGTGATASQAFRPAFTDGQPAPFDFAGEPFDYGYAPSEDAFDASSAGQPLGALIWQGLTVANFDLAAAATSFLVVPQGGQVSFSFVIANNSNNAVSGDLFFEAFRNGNQVTRGRILSGSLASDAWFPGGFTQNVPGSAPTGDYEYRISIGTFPSQAIDTETFTVTVVPASGPVAEAGWSIAEATPWPSSEAAAEDAVAAAWTPEAGVSAYPNPFAERAEIAFTLAERADVSLTVYDVRGRAVATLADGPMAAGQHAVAFDAAALPSGVYVYRLAAGQRVETGRMTLVR
ncbi:MAG: T9SS type A sorting domain-containing protein [Bacteroidota bacterium]